MLSRRPTAALAPAESPLIPAEPDVVSRPRALRPPKTFGVGLTSRCYLAAAANAFASLRVGSSAATGLSPFCGGGRSV